MARLVEIRSDMSIEAKDCALTMLEVNVRGDKVVIRRV